jgi:hypothetical protein
MEQLYQYKNLLDQVKAINIRYRKINELTGDNFNIFRILKVESAEVRMHSAFLAELLNPKGSHGQKDVFLKLFVSAFCVKNNLIDTLSCKVKVEDDIGRISADKFQGGRIDVVITDKHNHQIIIENKIYAGDQDHQLTRYFNYSSTADIIYLTLEGKSPSENSKGDMKEEEHFRCSSYKHDILHWLELCRKEVAIYPIVREAITHYINLIKYLTNQTQNRNMQEELSDLLKSNLEASFTIYDNLNNACDKLSKEFGEDLEKEFDLIGLSCDYGVNYNKNYSGIWIKRPEWKHVHIGFQFQSYDKDLIYGFITRKHPNQFPIPVDVRNRVKTLPNNTPKNNDWWPWYNRLEAPYNNWDKFQAWQAIIDGQMKSIIIEKTNSLIDLTKDMDL